MKNHVKYIAILFTLALSACATIQNPIGITDLASVESAYGVALSVAVGYHDSCAKKLIPRSCRAIVVKLQAADRVAQAALVRARSFVKNNPTLGAGSVIQIAKDAVDDFILLENMYGIR